MREHDLSSADGTVLRAWRHGRGRAALLCPGLGTVPEAWPSLLHPDAGVRLGGWYHRGTLGSARPVDPARVTMADHVADAEAVHDRLLADTGAERTLVIGWSVGVSTAVDLALRRPDRVSGLLLVAGVPGQVHGPALTTIPSAAHAAAMTVLVGMLSRLAKLGTAVTGGMRATPAVLRAVAVTDFFGPAAHQPDAARAADRFLTHDWDWYAHLVRATEHCDPPDLTALRCPVSVLLGERDVLAHRSVAGAAYSTIPQARVRLLPTTHFVPLEAPHTVLDELRLLAHRVDALDEAVRSAHGRPVDPPLTDDSRPGA